MGTIISGFPGVGKTFYKENSKLKVFDSDSSLFSWLQPGVRNPEFPKNYIEHIKHHVSDADFVLVSSHKEVRQALVAADMLFVLVFPRRYLKQEYIKRFIGRGSSEAFVDLLDANWDAWIEELEAQSGCIRIHLEYNEFLADIL